MQIEINDINKEIEYKLEQIEYLVKEILRIEQQITNLEYIKTYGNTGGC